MGKTKYILRDKNIYRTDRDPVRCASNSVSEIVERLQQLALEGEDVGSLDVVELPEYTHIGPFLMSGRDFLNKHGAEEKE
jgi:hypothetical protein